MVVVISMFCGSGCDGCGGSMLGFGFSGGICVVWVCSKTTECSTEEVNSNCFLVSWMIFACMCLYLLWIHLVATSHALSHSSHV